MSDNVYDVIVVGAGVEGSATAYYLASRYTNNVLLLEQFKRLHGKGSSHGGSRITRKAYHKSFYAKMMNSAFKMWSEIENESGKTIYHQTGILIFGDNDVEKYIQALRNNNHPHIVMTGKELTDKYTDQLKLPDDYVCVMEQHGGLLEASTAVGALQQLFVERGGCFKDECTVSEVLPGDVVTVVTTRGRFRTKKLILTTGAWTNRLLQPLRLQLPLKAVRTEALYWAVAEEKNYQKESFPCFIYTTTHQTHRYGIPIHEHPGLFKVCFHDGLELSSPEDRDAITGSVTKSRVSSFIGQHFKGVSMDPAIMEVCMYTNTPDGDPVIDKHPCHSNIVIGTGFSGQGFKLAPVVGQLLTELALNLRPSHDMTPFRINRFEHFKSSL